MQVINRPGSGETCLSPRSPPRHADTRKRLTVGLHELNPLIARGSPPNRGEDWPSVEIQTYLSLRQRYQHPHSDLSGAPHPT